LIHPARGTRNAREGPVQQDIDRDLDLGLGEEQAKLLLCLIAA
jgi:hypothetical protein